MGEELEGLVVRGRRLASNPRVPVAEALAGVLGCSGPADVLPPTFDAEKKKKKLTLPHPPQYIQLVNGLTVGEGVGVEELRLVHRVRDKNLDVRGFKSHCGTSIIGTSFFTLSFPEPLVADIQHGHGGASYHLRFLCHLTERVPPPSLLLHPYDERPLSHRLFGFMSRAPRRLPSFQGRVSDIDQKGSPAVRLSKSPGRFPLTKRIMWDGQRRGRGGRHVEFSVQDRHPLPWQIHPQGS